MTEREGILMDPAPFPSRGNRMRRVASAFFAIVVSVLMLSVTSATAASATISFSTPQVIGFVKGDDWEPDVAADGRGNVYVAWAHFGDVRGCDTCSDPAALLQVSRDGGRLWQA